MDRPLVNIKSNPPSHKAVCGFTILEVMVALAILSIALTGIYRLHGQTMVMSAKARFHSLAPMLAKAKLSDVQQQSYDELTAASGDYGSTHPGYEWSLRFEDVPSELFTESSYHLTRIDIDITQSEENHYHLRTYLFFLGK